MPNSKSGSKAIKAKERATATLLDVGANFSVSRRHVLYRYLLEALSTPGGDDMVVPVETPVPNDVVGIIASYVYSWVMITANDHGMSFWAPKAAAADTGSATTGSGGSGGSGGTGSGGAAGAVAAGLKLARSWLTSDSPHSIHSSQEITAIVFAPTSDHPSLLIALKHNTGGGDEAARVLSPPRIVCLPLSATDALAATNLDGRFESKTERLNHAPGFAMINARKKETPECNTANGFIRMHGTGRIDPSPTDMLFCRPSD